MQCEPDRLNYHKQYGAAGGEASQARPITTAMEQSSASSAVRPGRDGQRDRRPPCPLGGLLTSTGPQDAAANDGDKKDHRYPRSFCVPPFPTLAPK